MSDSKQIASGVQDLIHRIRDDGVKAAKLQADSVLREARKKAAQIIGDAKETQAMAEASDPGQPVIIVPAFTGLGTAVPAGGECNRAIQPPRQAGSCRRQSRAAVL